MSRLKLHAVIFTLIFLVLGTGCKRSRMPEAAPEHANLGYTGTDDMSSVPLSVNISSLGYSGTANLPSRVDLAPLLPPVGDQGNYGTCVGWGVAYYTLTAVEGLEKGLNTIDLQSKKNQGSPKDLFLAIPNDLKSPNCDGTNIGVALDVLLSRGVATQKTVPYIDLQNCDNNLSLPEWDKEAKDHKIKSYRTIGGTVPIIKQYLAHNTPIIFGATLYENFFSWRTDDVLSSNSGRQAGGHCMTIVGYDDAKGPNGAFKIVNSWTTNFGDKGFIWIDYQFFVSQFVRKFAGVTPIVYVIDDATTPLDTFRTTGPDLAAWVSNDYPVDYSGTRQMIFNIYNSGSTTITALQPWDIVFLYYNAYDLNDFDVIFWDSVNTNVPLDSVRVNGNFATLNTAIPPNGNLGLSLFGTPAIRQTYTMPDISGNYYLVLIAGLGNPFSETNTMNNTFYTTPDPKSFTNGFSNKGVTQQGSPRETYQFVNTTTPSKDLFKMNRFNSAVTPSQLNAYRPDEVVKVLKANIASGDLAEKVARFRSSAPHIKQTITGVKK
jgi:C1A family cysteine protease